MIQLFETFLHQIVEIAILTFEFIGVGIIIYSGLQGFFLYLKRSPATKLTLAKGLAMGLEFKLGSEICGRLWCVNGKKSRQWQELSYCGRR